MGSGGIGIDKVIYLAIIKYMNNRIQRGNVAELIVAAEASKKDFVVSIPISHNSHYDLVLGKDKKLIKVQVKRAYKTNYHNKKTLCVEIRRISGGKKYHYERGDYDVLIGCDVDKNNFWILPINAIIDYKSQIYLETKNLITYKNRWDLL